MTGLFLALITANATGSAVSSGHPFEIADDITPPALATMSGMTTIPRDRKPRCFGPGRPLAASTITFSPGPPFAVAASKTPPGRRTVLDGHFRHRDVIVDTSLEADRVATRAAAVTLDSKYDGPASETATTLPPIVQAGCGCRRCRGSEWRSWCRRSPVELRGAASRATMAMRRSRSRFAELMKLDGFPPAVQAANPETWNTRS